jgi:hypothetical protein
VNTDPVILDPVKEPKYYKTIKVAEGSRQEIGFRLNDSDGRCLSLSNKAVVQNDPLLGDGDGIDAANPGFRDGVVPKGPWPDVSIRLVVSPGYGMEPLFTMEGTITDFEQAQVVFHLEPEHIDTAGIYMAEIGLFRGEMLMQHWPVYLSVEQSLFSKSQRRDRAGIISIPEVRLYLRDLDASYNDVLDELEFKDVEIMACIRKPVDIWNELLPFEPTLQFPYTKFPFRANWIRATSGYLLEMASHWYRRNDIPVAAGGVTIQDRNKHMTYEPKSQQLIQEFQVWAKQTKAALSAQMAFGSVQSPWPRSNLWR